MPRDRVEIPLPPLDRLMRGSRAAPRPAGWRGMLALGDLAMLGLASLASFEFWAIRVGNPPFLPFLVHYWRWPTLLTALWTAFALASGLYAHRVATDLRSTASTLLKVLALSLSSYLLIYFVSSPTTILRSVAVAFTIVATFLVGVWRAVFIAWIDGLRLRRRAIVVGTGPEADALVRTVRSHLRREYDLVGFVGPGGEAGGERIEDLARLGTISELPTLVQQHLASEVILCLGPGGQAQEDIAHVLSDCYHQGVAILPMEILWEEIPGDAWAATRRGWEHAHTPVWSHGRKTLSTLGRRWMDTLVALGGLLTFAVVFPFLVLIVYLYSLWARFTGTRGRGKSPLAPAGS